MVAGTPATLFTVHSTMPLLAEADIPWVYVAMIVIAFISWVFRKIQESTAARRMREYEEQKKAWDAFRKAPAWQALKKEEQYKDTVSKITSIFLVATDYSSVK